MIVQRTLDILEYFEPTYWMIENPQSGLLKEQIQMYGLPYRDIDYCKYGMPYRKRTRIWNNVFTWTPRPLCVKDCGDIVDNKHTATAQRGPSGKRETWATQPRFSLRELYSPRTINHGAIHEHVVVTCLIKTYTDIYHHGLERIHH